MNILLLTEGKLIEDEIILSRLPNNSRIERANLSRNVFTTNFLKYDLIIISFVPSFDTPHFKLIESLLRLKKILISMNMDQNNFYFDYAFRGNSYKFLCKIGLKLFVINKNFEGFLESLNLGSSILKNDNFDSGCGGADVAYSSNNLIFVFDLRWATATDEFVRYKRRVGYSDTVMRSAKKYSLLYMEGVVSSYKEIMNKFQFKRAYICFEYFGEFEEIKDMCRVLFLDNIEIIDARRLSELLLTDSIVLTNWDVIELSKYRDYLNIFLINFCFQNAFNYFSKIPTGQGGEVSITGNKFELRAVESKSVVLDIEGLYSDCRNFEQGHLFKPCISIESIAVAYYAASSFLILIATQLRFSLYAFKTMMKSILLK